MMALRCGRGEGGSSPSVGSSLSASAKGAIRIPKPETSGFDSCRRCQSIWTFAMCALKKKKTGAGEGIRTLDPDLGKVVLYP